jgi:uncharacterized protein YecT (DUF1311 family)
MKKLLATLLFLAISLTAHAHPHEWTNNPPDSAQTQLEINQWAGLEYKDADDQLNRVWKKLTPKLGAAEKKALTDAQLIWIKFRDANAEAAAAAYEGGSIAPYIYTQSRTESTRMRTFQLKQRLDELIRLGN